MIRFIKGNFFAASSNEQNSYKLVQNCITGTGTKQEDRRGIFQQECECVHLISNTLPTFCMHTNLHHITRHVKVTNDLL